MQFLDRLEERRRLAALLNGKTGALACLYGRRRCGKTRLLREVTKSHVGIFFTADRSDRAAQIVRFVHESSTFIPILASAATRDWGTVLDLWMATAPAGSHLVLDEFPYLVEKDPSLPSVLQRIADRIVDRGLKIVICGSSQRMMQGFVLKASEPLYGRAKEILPIEPLAFPWLKRAFPKLTPFEQVKTWGVWGGVLRYWELQDPKRTLWENVRELVAAPLGLLHNEPQFLLLDDVSDAAQASAVLAFIGNGAHRVSEIAARMGRAATDLSRPIQRLTELGLIVRESPFGSEKTGKKSLYCIADPFLDFWYRFIWPNYSREDFLATAAERKAFDAAFRTHLGGVWERLVRTKLAKEEGGRYRNVARWWGAGTDGQPMEFDVVGESPDGNTLFVGECKLSLKDAEIPRVLDELKAKAIRLPFAKKYARMEARVFVAENGNN